MICIIIILSLKIRNTYLDYWGEAMKMAVFAFFTMVMAAFTWTIQSDGHVTMEGRDRLKYALDIATHDAAQQIDLVQLNNGLIRFNESQVTSVGLQRLQDNLKLDGNMQPLPNNLFRSSDQLQVVYYDTVETGCPNKAPGFPCVYNINLTVNTASGPRAINYVDTLSGPGVVAIITMPSPQPYGISKEYTYIVGSSHEYKPF